MVRSTLGVRSMISMVRSMEKSTVHHPLVSDRFPPKLPIELLAILYEYPPQRNDRFSFHVYGCDRIVGELLLENQPLHTTSRAICECDYPRGLLCVLPGLATSGTYQRCAHVAELY
jgi:hypothetical protein